MKLLSGGALPGTEPEKPWSQKLRSFEPRGIEFDGIEKRRLIEFRISSYLSERKTAFFEGEG
jgi:hypothetical protein